MATDFQFDGMTVPEKLALLEAVWADLASNPVDVESPDWHREILEERAAEAERGEYMKWDDAKRWIQDQLDGD